MAGGTVALLPNPEMAAPPSPATVPKIGSSAEQWEVEFSRFFSYPPPPPTALELLHPLPKSKTRSRGTWISAASQALLRIIKPHAAASSDPVISVSLSGFVIEEHFVSKLHFSWPQVSCVSQCPIRGSRAVFLSYRDYSSQANRIQKFAVRFSSCDVAETFLNAVKNMEITINDVDYLLDWLTHVCKLPPYFGKECLRDAIDIAGPADDIACENSSASEFIASNGLHRRVDDELSYEEPVVTYAPEMPALTFRNEYSDSPSPPLLTDNVETIFASLPSLPPSFTELLNNCSTGTGEERAVKGEESGCSIQNGECLPNPSLHSSAEQPKPIEEADLKTQIAKYMSDASFHDMLFKIEKVIDELGDDLVL